MLKLKLQYFDHLMWRTDSLEKTLMLGKIDRRWKGDNRGWDGWMASLTQWTWVLVNSRSWWWTGRPGMLQFRGSQRVGHDWATELNWRIIFTDILFSSVAQSCPTPCSPWTAAHQASLSIINSQSLLKLMSIESVMPSKLLILCRPLLLPSSVFPSIRVFKWVSSSNQVVKVLEFQLQHQSFQWIFRTSFL